jgi:hypothetical protein
VLRYVEVKNLEKFVLMTQRLRHLPNCLEATNYFDLKKADGADS